ncbi:hypothetical protein LAUMK4_03307 [Mycobacterium persicum]|uniref:Uncharacterized protein n=1 Tax=Mycobacterium persicum TaxID=1487726 RepID=A0AB38UV35_9MYCO|nr:hypothetical protein LAUMK15_03619 [Mycobacterium persicum]VAZ84533.1 hypothetical protein LAUMK42_03356 [Mycobacterium persicum]VAZ95893.1 hypothetical protein LAUMK4_03307 [Mycobacterium persicum]
MVGHTVAAIRNFHHHRGVFALMVMGLAGMFAIDSHPKASEEYSGNDY